MKVFSNFPHELPEAREFPVVALGVFDGLHLGHQKILATSLEIAAGRPIALVTFDPHPRAILGPHKHSRLLSPLAERLELIQKWPLAAVAVLRFDQQIAQQSYVDFVRTALLDGLGAEHLVLGYNVRLGANRQGNRESLTKLGQELGFEVTIVSAVEIEDQPVSSTRVRHALDQGQMEEASRYLGRPYTLRGIVVRGSGRGRAMGVPTANLQLNPQKLIPANGVYAVRAQVGSIHYLGALNIGLAPTFGAGRQQTVEVHLLDYVGDLYGLRLEIEVLTRLRDEQRFASPEDLKSQIVRDIAGVRRKLAGQGSLPGAARPQRDRG